MNRFIKKEINNLNLDSFNFVFETLDFQNEVEFHKKIGLLFSYNNQYKYPLWDNVRPMPTLGVRNIDGWRLIGDFVSSGKYLLFFDYCQDPTVYSFNSIRDIVLVLENCSGFTFYITNSNFDFMLVFNDHDYLIAWGKAIPFVKNISSNF